jgi:spermidine synthase
LKKSYYFITLLIFLALSSNVFATEKKGTTLFEKNSLYQYLVVSEDPERNERYVYNSRRDYVQGGISLVKPDSLLFEYTRISFISLAFLDRKPEDVLFVGLGAGAMPRYFNRYYPDVNTEVVEIDSEMFDVAKKYFHFKETPKMKVYTQDGRMFIKRAKKKYDMIFLDAYQADYIPFHMTTIEFLAEVKKILKKGGVVVSNIVSPFKNKYYYSMIETYRKAFPHVYVFRGKTKNFIFIASLSEEKMDEGDVMKRAKAVQKEKNFDIDLPMICTLYGYSDEFGWDGEILTDDFAPVNLYKHMRARDSD